MEPHWGTSYKKGGSVSGAGSYRAFAGSDGVGPASAAQALAGAVKMSFRRAHRTWALKESATRLSSIADSYHALVVWVVQVTYLPNSLLHVHAGMAIFVAASLVTRRPRGGVVPFAVVCVAELVNEVMDRFHAGSWQWADTSVDVLNTLFWPFVLVLIAPVGRAGFPNRAGSS